jgi:uncharacterized membrane protein (DUF373 family)
MEYKRGNSMGQIRLMISAILSLIVSILNFTDHRYVYGTFGAIIFVFVVIELIKQLRSKIKR